MAPRAHLPLLPCGPSPPQALLRLIGPRLVGVCGGSPLGALAPASGSTPRAGRGHLVLQAPSSRPLQESCRPSDKHPGPETTRVLDFLSRRFETKTPSVQSKRLGQLVPEPRRCSPGPDHHQGQHSGYRAAGAPDRCAWLAQVCWYNLKVTALRGQALSRSPLSPTFPVTHLQHLLSPRSCLR